MTVGNVPMLRGKAKAKEGVPKKRHLTSPNYLIGNLIEFTTISIFAFFPPGSSLFVSANSAISFVLNLPVMWFPGHNIATDGILQHQCNCNGCRECPGHWTAVNASSKTVLTPNVPWLEFDPVNSLNSAHFVSNCILWHVNLFWWWTALSFPTTSFLLDMNHFNSSIQFKLAR